MNLVLISGVACAAVSAGILAPELVEASRRSMRKVLVRKRVRGMRPSPPAGADVELRMFYLLVSVAGLLPVRSHRMRHEREGLSLLVERAGLSGTFTAGEIEAYAWWFALACAVLGACACSLVGIAGAVVGAAIGWCLGVRYPGAYLKRLAARRGKECLRDLPMMLDVLAMGMKAGLSFDAAFSIYVTHVSGALSDECRIALQGWRSGVLLREEALHRMARRLDSDDVKRFVDMVLQSIALGSPLGKVLGEMAVEMRARRSADVEERIAKAPVKMLVPTGVLILPAMLIVVMGPVVIELLTGLS